MVVASVCTSIPQAAVVVGMTMVPQAHVFKHLVPSRCNCLGEGLGVALLEKVCHGGGGWALRFHSPIIPSKLSLFCACGSGISSQLLVGHHACLPAALLLP